MQRDAARWEFFASRELGGVHAPVSRHAALTPAERAIAIDLLGALSTRAIAEVHGIALSTARNHLAAIYRRVGAHSRAEAMLWAAAHEQCCLVMPWERPGG